MGEITEQDVKEFNDYFARIEELRFETFEDLGDVNPEEIDELFYISGDQLVAIKNLVFVIEEMAEHLSVIFEKLQKKGI